MVLRWGIVSAGKISNDFVNAVQTLPKKEHEIVAIAARSGASAEEFAKSHNIPKWYEGYEKLAEDPDVDVVYVACLNPQHYPVSKMMLEHDKHVLCEKPLTLNELQTRHLIKIANKRKKFLKEAVWSRSFPAYKELKRILNSGEIGTAIHVNVSFGFNLQNVERIKKRELGGGAILDLGVYALQFQQFVYKDSFPSVVKVSGKLNQNGTDDYLDSMWTFIEDRTGVISISAIADYPNEAIIVGTKGIIRVPDFWCPTKIITPSKNYKFPLPKSDAHYNFYNSVGLSYQADHVRQCILHRKLESPHITHDQSIQLARCMDILRKQVGLEFPEDRQRFQDP